MSQRPSGAKRVLGVGSYPPTGVLVTYSAKMHSSLPPDKVLSTGPQNAESLGQAQPTILTKSGMGRHGTTLHLSTWISVRSTWTHPPPSLTTNLASLVMEVSTFSWAPLFLLKLDSSRTITRISSPLLATLPGSHPVSPPDLATRGPPYILQNYLP